MSPPGSREQKGAHRKTRGDPPTFVAQRERCSRKPRTTRGATWPPRGPYAPKGCKIAASRLRRQLGQHLADRPRLMFPWIRAAIRRCCYRSPAPDSVDLRIWLAQPADRVGSSQHKAAPAVEAGPHWAPPPTAGKGFVGWDRWNQRGNRPHEATEKTPSQLLRRPQQARKSSRRTLQSC
jgi:hypothetical protein